MTTTELRRDAWISGKLLRFADVLRWQKSQEGIIPVAQGLPDIDCLVGYLLHRAAIDLCGRGGVVVRTRTNAWSEDGRNEDIEVTVGRVAPPSTGATWTGCRSYWFYRRASEIEPAAEALALYRRYRKAEDDLYAEQVEVDYAAPQGAGVETHRFWIVYPPHRPVIMQRSDSLDTLRTVVRRQGLRDVRRYGEMADYTYIIDSRTGQAVPLRRPVPASVSELRVGDTIRFFGEGNKWTKVHVIEQDTVSWRLSLDDGWQYASPNTTVRRLVRDDEITKE